ncbi:MAG TPA: hypothetical protein VMT58_07315, partial [Candidatus Binataceae bacterium]|nr:hypothetical protein [Candidatus Binataceae bacterium]
NAQFGNFPTSGSGCTSSDGTVLALTLTTGFESEGFVEIDTVSLSLPSLTGEVVGQILESTGLDTFGPDTGVTGGVCGTTPIAAVTHGEAAPAARSGDGKVGH